MKILTFKEFMKKYNLKDDTMNESQLQKIYNYSVCPKNSIIYSDRAFVNIDDGRQGGTHWTCFIIKDDKFFYYDSFGGAPDKFLLNQLPKPIIYHNYKFKI